MNVLKLLKNDGTEVMVCQFTYREYQDVAMSVLDTMTRRYISDGLFDTAMAIYQCGSTVHDVSSDLILQYFNLIDFWNSHPNNPVMLAKPTVKKDGSYLEFNTENKKIISDIWLEAYTIYKRKLCSISDFFQTYYPVLKTIDEDDKTRFTDYRLERLQDFANRVAIWQSKGVSYGAAVDACLDDVPCDGMTKDEILKELGEFTPAPVPESEKLILTAGNVKTDNRQYEHRTNEWLEAKIQDAGYEDDEDLADQRKLRKYAEKLGLQRKY